MTANHKVKISDAPFDIQLPDPPPPEDMHNQLQLTENGNVHFLAQYLGNRDTTLVTGEAYISPAPTSSQEGLFAPDLLVAFNVDRLTGIRRNGYVISDLGKPPDFVLEGASRTTGRRDVTVKRDGYAALGIPEYWRFDVSGGAFHGVPLAGDRLVNGVYETITIDKIDDQTYEGYSPILNVILRWEQKTLGWYDPATGRHITTFEDERNRADAAEQQQEAERQARIQSQQQLDAALARIRDLEEELRRREE